DIGAVPATPFEADEHTVGLWHLDGLVDGAFPDASSRNNPFKCTPIDGRSMDDLDREAFDPGPSPWEGPFERATLEPGAAEHAAGPVVVSLDGEWQLAEGGDDADRLAAQTWADAVPAEVPGSVHTALVRAGVIPDPTVGKNDAEARMKSTKTWWYRRTFSGAEGLSEARLVFDGVAIRCTVWLNGEELGRHEGMFGGPMFDVGSRLREGENTLVVKIDPAP